MKTFLVVGVTTSGNYNFERLMGGNLASSPMVLMQLPAITGFLQRLPFLILSAA
jgi:hypothetical protein